MDLVVNRAQCCLGNETVPLSTTLCLVVDILQLCSLGLNKDDRMG